MEQRVSEMIERNPLAYLTNQTFHPIAIVASDPTF